MSAKNRKTKGFVGEDSNPVIESLRGGLIASCQPVEAGAMDRPEIVAAMACAAVAGGAVGLRIEGIENLRAVRPRVDVPIIGIIKSVTQGSPVRITATQEHARALVAEGADIVAYDATDQPRQSSPDLVLNAILEAGTIAMADCATLRDGTLALNGGATILGTTLSGYTAETSSSETGPDYQLIREFSQLGAFVMAEGRINTPEQAKRAMMAGANAVTVGTSLTRLEIITGEFVRSLNFARSNPELTGFAIDLGGTKTAAAKIENGRVVERIQKPTDGTSDPSTHIQLMRELLEQLGYRQGDQLGVAVTGRVDDTGHWHAINQQTLSGVAAVPLHQLLHSQFGTVSVVNDAAAATSAEHNFGSGRGFDDFAYITVSTGVAGGLILNGRLHRSSDGLAGHLGFSSSTGGTATCGSGRIGTVESVASGSAIAKQAQRVGLSDGDARQVFDLARQGVDWAEELFDNSALSIARLAADLATILGIRRIAVGGSIGLSEGYIERIRKHIDDFPPLFFVEIVPAKLGVDAPLLGALSMFDKD